MNTPQPASNYDVFISYRREGGDAQALWIREKLMQRGLRVFLDVVDLKQGYFDEKLLHYIAITPNFLVILSPGAMDRCVTDGDWLRQEIAQAVKSKCNVIPVMLPGFRFPDVLPEDIRNLPRHQGIEYSHIYHVAMVDMILRSVEAARQEAPPPPPPPVPVPSPDPVPAPIPKPVPKPIPKPVPIPPKPVPTESGVARFREFLGVRDGAFQWQRVLAYLLARGGAAALAIIVRMFGVLGGTSVAYSLRSLFFAFAGAALTVLAFRLVKNVLLAVPLAGMFGVIFSFLLVPIFGLAAGDPAKNLEGILAQFCATVITMAILMLAFHKLGNGAVGIAAGTLVASILSNVIRELAYQTSNSGVAPSLIYGIEYTVVFTAVYVLVMKIPFGDRRPARIAE